MALIDQPVREFVGGITAPDFFGAAPSKPLGNIVFPGLNALGELRQIGNTDSLNGALGDPFYTTSYNVNVSAKYVTLLSSCIPRSSHMIVDGNQNRVIPVVPRQSVLVNIRRRLRINITDFLAVNSGTISARAGTYYYWLFSDEPMQSNQSVGSLETQVDFIQNGTLQNPRLEIRFAGNFQQLTISELVGAKYLKLVAGRGLGSTTTVFSADIEDYRFVNTAIFAALNLSRIVGSLEWSTNFLSDVVYVSPTVKRITRKVLNPSDLIAFSIEGVTTT